MPTKKRKVTRAKNQFALNASLFTANAMWLDCARSLDEILNAFSRVIMNTKALQNNKILHS
jgi:hypothetical protein